MVCFRLACAPQPLPLIAALAQLESLLLPHPWGEASLTSTLAQPGIVLAVAEDEGGRLLAYCLIQQVLDEATVLQMGTAPCAQRQGIAGRLLSLGLTALQASGCVTLWLEVRASNTAARALYRRLGFVVETVRKRYYPALVPGEPDEDALVMRRPLDPASLADSA